MKILLIEDQENLAKLIKKGLESEGMATDYLVDGELGLTSLLRRHAEYDVTILDIMLPKRSGLEICKQIREQKISIPVLMLTACDQNNDIVNGLNVGADDYLIKPFAFEVLVARIHALARRPEQTLPAELSIQNIVLNTITKQVLKGTEEIRLTQKEFALLEYFMRHPNVVLSRGQILSNLWDFAFDTFSNVVDVHITNLRKKIGDDQGTFIESIYGAGYKLHRS